MTIPRNPLLPPVPLPAPPHRWGLGAYVAAEIVFVGLSTWNAFSLLGSDTTAVRLALALAVPTVAAAGVALLFTWWRGNGPVIDLRIRVTSRDVGTGFAFGVGGLFLSLPAAAVYAMVAGEDASSAVGNVFEGVQTDPVTALLVAAVVVLVAPVCEEIVYRGLLWGGLSRLGAGAWLTFAITTAVFAMAHFELERAPLLVIIALPIGLARLYSDGLAAPIVAHQVNNLLPGIGLYLAMTGALPAV